MLLSLPNSKSLAPLMDSNIKIDLDKLPIKRIEAIEESGVEHFPSEISNEETRLNAIRRIDFSSIIERDSKKAKSSKESPAAAAATPAWPWQSLVENLRQAHQELNVVIDLINTVEANDAVTVAWMQRPKQLPNEVLSDLSVSAATKLQRLRHLGRYFKQSSKALEQQVSREARFYGSLIRLQHNWKVKRQRLMGTVPGNESFTIDLQDNSILDGPILSRPSSLSTVRIDEDSAGILAVQRPLKSCHSLCLGFLGANRKPRSFTRRKVDGSKDHLSEVKKDAFTDKDALTDEDVNQCVKDTHSTLREIHQSIFQEQVFDMVNRETWNPSPGVNMTGMREDFLQLAIGQETSICLYLVPSGKNDEPQTNTSIGQTQNKENGDSCSEQSQLMVIDEKHDSTNVKYSGLPDPVSLEIYLQYLFHETVLIKAREKRSHGLSQVSGQSAGQGGSLLGHFCLTIAHRIFSKKVLSKLETLVGRVPYLHLLSHPTWSSRTSSWSVSLKVPQSILHSGRRIKASDNHDAKTGTRSHFHTKVVVNNDQISVSAEGAPSIVGSFRGNATNVCLINSYGCDLEDLPMTILQQVASQVILWLHEEASVVGMKASQDFLSLKFNLDQGETLSLVAHIDPHDVRGCISWWLIVDHSSSEEGQLLAENGGSDYKTFLGYLTLEVLYSTVMDLVSFCGTSGSY